MRGATVLLAYDPRSATAWLRDLVDAHPSLGLSLCDIHAERTSVPMGWECIDERRPAWQSYDVDSPFEVEFEPLNDLDIAPPARGTGRDQGADAKTKSGATPSETDAEPSAPEPITRSDAFAAEPEVPLAAEVRTRRRLVEEQAFHNSPAPADVEAVQLEMSAFAEVDALDDDDETFDAEDWAFEDDSEDDFDEIFGLGPDDADAGGTPFDNAPFDNAASDSTYRDPVQPAVLTSVADDEWEAAAYDDLAPFDAAPFDAAPFDANDLTVAGEELADEAEDFDPPQEEPGVAERDQLDDAGEIEPTLTESDTVDRAEAAPNPTPEPAAPPHSVPVEDEADISFDDIFPTKVNQPEEPHSSTPTRIERMADVQTFSERERQRSLFGSEDATGAAPGLPDIEDDYDRHATQNKPVAQGNTAERGTTSVPTVAPSPGPPRIEPRPSWMPTRQGATSRLHVESSSPLLGRAFGFVQRD